MPTITLTDVPEDLHLRLKMRATKHRRSLNSEILACLEEATMTPEGRLDRIRSFRDSLGVRPLSEGDVERAIRAGRP